MKMKELLVPLILALATTWGLQHFFGRNDQQEQVQTSGQRFEAPTTTQVTLHKPLNLEVDFVDGKAGRPEQLTTIETADTRYVFSNNGACLQQIAFFRNWGGKEGYLSTLPAVTEHDREQCTFLVALQAKTPYYFDLIHEEHAVGSHVLTYRADFGAGVMYKKFTIAQDAHKIDLELTLEPKAGHTLVPRLFYASPYITDESAEDIITAISNEGSGGIRQESIGEMLAYKPGYEAKFKDKRFAQGAQATGNYWFKPHIFGTMDRYFVHTLIHDNQNFAQRGYYKLASQDQLYSILEGSPVTEKQTWNMSFYMGPKTSKDFAAVDGRLDGVIRYGFLAPISRPISHLMLELLNKIYDYCGNYGWAIIILTVLFKLIMLPFTMRGESNMADERNKRAQFEKKLKHLQDKYKNDPKGLAEARAELIKKHGLPGLGGCLPVLIQLPMFWGLSIVFSQSIELYKAPFLWIPDLSLPDPYYILPVLGSLAVMFHNPTGDPKQRVTSLIMGVVFGAVMINFSAGLVLYICVSTALGVMQTLLLKWWKSRA